MSSQMQPSKQPPQQQQHHHHHRSTKRSAVRVTISPSQRILELQKKIVEIEQRLIAISKTTPASSKPQQDNHNDAETVQVNHYRSQLCEKLCDLILYEPSMAQAPFDAVGRLWRHCFYERIKRTRARIQKEKKKRTTPNNNNNSSSSHQQQQFQDSLHIFLREGVTLFDYLCDRMQKKLLPSEQQEREEESETPHSVLVHDRNQDKRGIVACLHRLYVHLGDLHRYAEKYPSASAAYWTAAHLGPGIGHSYNQLAVVAQVQQQQQQNSAAMISVYWYARALAATVEPFGTAHANLQRLLALNREWIQNQNHPQPGAPVQLAGNASRWFLAQFVDLIHSVLFATLASSSSQPEPINHQFYNRLGEAGEALASLLRASTLGDSLICKLVAILAFAEYYYHHQQQQQQQKEGNDSMPLAIRTMLFEFGVCLAERVHGMLKMKLERKQPPSQPSPPFPSIRVLTPLLLHTEYLLFQHAQDSETMNHMGNQNRNPEGQQLHDAALVEFWKTIVQIYNQLQSFPGTTPVTETTLTLKEYQELRGFAPFHGFLQDGSVTEQGFLNDAAAMELFMETEASSTQNSTTQESASVNRHHSSSQATVGSHLSGNTSQEETARIKIQRFVMLRPKLLSLDFSRYGYRIREGSNDQLLEWSRTDDVIHDDGGDMIVDLNNVGEVATDFGRNIEDLKEGGDIVMMQETQSICVGNARKDDVLVYQKSDYGGPALLVPGGLFQNHGDSPQKSMLEPKLQSETVATSVMEGQDFTERSMIGDTILEQSSIFGETLNRFPRPRACDDGPVYALPLNRGVGAFTSVANVLPPPGFALDVLLRQDDNHNIPIHGLIIPPHPIATERVPTAGESYLLFGGPSAAKTSNPFAADSMPSLPPISGFLSQQQALFQQDMEFLQDDSMAPDGTPLLDSQLLSSLLMDDGPRNAPTNNPFAT
jgi:hypothetical protein